MPVLKGATAARLMMFFSPKVFLIAAIVFIAKVFNVEVPSHTTTPHTISKPNIFKEMPPYRVR